MRRVDAQIRLLRLGREAITDKEYYDLEAAKGSPLTWEPPEHREKPNDTLGETA